MNSLLTSIGYDLEHGIPGETPDEKTRRIETKESVSSFYNFIAETYERSGDTTYRGDNTEAEFLSDFYKDPENFIRERIEGPFLAAAGLSPFRNGNLKQLESAEFQNFANLRYGYAPGSDEIAELHGQMEDMMIGVDTSRDTVAAYMDNAQRELTIQDVKNRVMSTYGKEIDDVEAQNIMDGDLVRVVPDDWIASIPDPLMRQEILSLIHGGTSFQVAAKEPSLSETIGGFAGAMAGQFAGGAGAGLFSGLFGKE